MPLYNKHDCADSVEIGREEKLKEDGRMEICAVWTKEIVLQSGFVSGSSGSVQNGLDSLSITTRESADGRPLFVCSIFHQNPPTFLMMAATRRF